VGVRSQESGVRSQESGVRSQESGVRSQESEVRSQKSEVRTSSTNFSNGAEIKPGIYQIPNILQELSKRSDHWMDLA